MLFSSWEFMLVFLPTILAVFFCVPVEWRTTRKAWLAVASLFFYGWWKVEYVLLLVVSIGINYLIAEWLVRSQGRPHKRWILGFGVTANLALLGYFKYTNFFGDLVAGLSNAPVGHVSIILPLAISFYTFTQIGYLVDVCRDPKLHYHWIDYSLFVVFFPHLIAGPIVRHWEIIPQYADRDLRVNRSDLGVGLALFLMGLYKKVIFADNASNVANAIYTAADGGVVLPWFDAWLGTIAYAMQIYFDFSGYSDMAVGIARLFGIKFPANFDSPYRASSIIEFWQRWHITLTRFLREHLYYPLGGNRLGPSRQAINIMATMLLSGLWHGADWMYVLWGGLHGLGLVINHQWRSLGQRLGWHAIKRQLRWLCVGATFAFVLVTWVPFRASSLPAAQSVWASMLGLHGITLSERTANPERQPGKALAAAGVRFVPDVAKLTSYDAAMKLTFGLLLIAWLLPNTQQLLRDYAPALEGEIRPSWWRLRLNLAGGLALGFAFFWVVRASYSAAPSPFLYFNF
jgi:alginate O-acetyltransferase complex protein AlgI